MSEITIICLEQNKRLKIDEKNLHIETWRSLGLTHGYGKTGNWGTIDCLKGRWYNIRSLKSYTEKDVVWDAYDLVEDETVDIQKSYLQLYPKDEFDDLFLQSYTGYENTSVKFLTESLKIEFLGICEKLIESSSVSTIVVLFRTNADSPEKIVGNISLKKFAEMLSTQQVFTNVAYVVKLYKERYWECTK